MSDIRKISLVLLMWIIFVDAIVVRDGIHFGRNHKVPVMAKYQHRLYRKQINPLINKTLPLNKITIKPLNTKDFVVSRSETGDDYNMENHQFELSDNYSNQDHNKRVFIKVYRGPGDGHDHFAPYGFWVKQPTDEYHHHK